MKHKKSFSMICALVTTFIWGTAFIAQDTGMDNIGLSHLILHVFL